MHIVAVVLLAVLVGVHTVLASDKPNIVLIFVDDMGYGDPGCYGGTLVPTPNIDRLAKDGILCTNGYVTAPVCAPSRYGLLAGAYQQRFGVQWNNDTFEGARGAIDIIPDDHLTIDQTLQNAGYVTGMAGKWNLEDYPHTTFDEAYSVIHFGANYYPDATGHYEGVDEPLPKSGFRRFLWGPEREGDEYLTDRIGRQTVAFIEEHKEEPFFFYLAFNAVHSPFMAKKALRDAVDHIDSEVLQYYAAMIISMDENIGMVIDALEQHGLRENTLIVFASDNGPATGETLKRAWPDDWPRDWPSEIIGSAGPLSGRKGQFREGGIRIPYIISWPARLEKAKVYERPVSTLDLYPTFCEAAGASVPESTKLDGVSLLPYLTGDQTNDPHDRLYWFSRERGAMRKGDWKLLVKENTYQLFNLREDIAEAFDMAGRRPELLEELKTDFKKFVGQMPPPLAE
jgi:arylsulfatase A-like enzyme